MHVCFQEQNPQDFSVYLEISYRYENFSFRSFKILHKFDDMRKNKNIAKTGMREN